MLFSSGDRTRELARRFNKYKDFIAKPGAAHTEFAQKYKQRILTVSEAPTAPGTYVPGDEIYGDELRKFSHDPIICGPLVCQLCDKDFISESSFLNHKKDVHAGEKNIAKNSFF